MKNYLGEREYQTWAGWRKAVKEAGAVRIDGDKDIATALDANGKGVGEWDGEKGSVYIREVRKNPSNRHADMWLEPFGSAVIGIMESSSEWDADTLESILAAADESELITADRNGYLKRNAKGKQGGTSVLARFSSRTLKRLEDDPEGDLEVIDLIAEDAIDSGLANLGKDGSLRATSEGMRRNPAGRSSFRKGDHVIGIMGVDGGYAGTVTSVTRDSRGRVLVTYVDDDGNERETFDFNLSKNVPARGTFPRHNPLRRKPGESDRDFMTRCMSAEKVKFPRQDQRVAVCLSKARRNPLGSGAGDV